MFAFVDFLPMHFFFFSIREWLSIRPATGQVLGFDTVP